MDEKTAPVKTDASASPPPASTEEKPSTPAPDAAKEQPVTPTSEVKPAESTPAAPTASPKKTSPFVRILIILFILVDLALAGYIVYRMMMS